MAQCRADVRRAVDAEDPEGLLGCGSAPGEYDPEVDDLVRLVQARAVTPSAVLTIWQRWFGPDSSVCRNPGVLHRLTSALQRIPPDEPAAR